MTLEVSRNGSDQGPLILNKSGLASELFLTRPDLLPRGGLTDVQIGGHSEVFSIDSLFFDNLCLSDVVSRKVDIPTFDMEKTFDFLLSGGMANTEQIKPNALFYKKHGVIALNFSKVPKDTIINGIRFTLPEAEVVLLNKDGDEIKFRKIDQ